MKCLCLRIRATLEKIGSACTALSCSNKHTHRLRTKPTRALISRSGREGQRHFPASQFSRTQSAQSVHALITNHSRPVARQIRPDTATTMPTLTELTGISIHMAALSRGRKLLPPRRERARGAHGRGPGRRAARSFRQAGAPLWTKCGVSHLRTGV
jgi:hypothetical protein